MQGLKRRATTCTCKIGRLSVSFRERHQDAGMMTTGQSASISIPRDRAQCLRRLTVRNTTYTASVSACLRSCSGRLSSSKNQPRLARLTFRSVRSLRLGDWLWAHKVLALKMVGCLPDTKAFPPNSRTMRGRHVPSGRILPKPPCSTTRRRLF